jgi:hypothetical protein
VLWCFIWYMLCSNIVWRACWALRAADGRYLLLAVSSICCHVVSWAGSAEAITHLNNVARVSRRPAGAQIGDKQQHMQIRPSVAM